MHSSFWISIFLGVFLARATPLGQASPPGQMSNLATNTAAHDPAGSREFSSHPIFSSSESPKSNAAKRANSPSGDERLAKAIKVVRNPIAVTSDLLGLDDHYNNRQTRHIPASDGQIPTHNSPRSPSSPLSSNATKRANTLSGDERLAKAIKVVRNPIAVTRGSFPLEDFNIRQTRHIPASDGQIPTHNSPRSPSSPLSSRDVSSPEGSAIPPARDAAFTGQPATKLVDRRQLRAADYNSDGPQANDSDASQSDAQTAPTNEQDEESGPQQVKERRFDGAVERVVRSSAAEDNDLIDGEGW